MKRTASKSKTEVKSEVRGPKSKSKWKGPRPGHPKSNSKSKQEATRPKSKSEAEVRSREDRIRAMEFAVAHEIGTESCNFRFDHCVGEQISRSTRSTALLGPAPPKSNRRGEPPQSYGQLSFSSEAYFEFEVKGRRPRAGGKPPLHPPESDGQLGFGA